VGKAGFVLFICLLATPCFAETWLCTYTNSKNEPTLTKLVIEGDKLTQDGRDDYQIAANNETGLVAGSGFSTIDPTTQRSVIFGTVLVLEKKTGNLKWAGTANYQDIPTTVGHCVKN
jgi:hypothetical protein